MVIEVSTIRSTIKASTINFVIEVSTNPIIELFVIKVIIFVEQGYQQLALQLGEFTSFKGLCSHPHLKHFRFLHHLHQLIHHLLEAPNILQCVLLPILQLGMKHFNHF